MKLAILTGILTQSEYHRVITAGRLDFCPKIIKPLFVPSGTADLIWYDPRVAAEISYQRQCGMMTETWALRQNLRLQIPAPYYVVPGKLINPSRLQPPC